MNNFEYYNPVKIIFGENSVAENLAAQVSDYNKIMLVYGHSALKRCGAYDEIINALTDKIVIEFGGINPNPKIEQLDQAVEIARKENVDFILAAGGGSVIDGTKYIAMAACLENLADSWNVVLGKQTCEAALPFGNVLTIPATGSEMNNIAVISSKEKHGKYGFKSPLLFPKFSILDPRHTLTLPPEQTANGIVDCFVHVVEQYLTYPANAPLQDRQAEAILSTLLEIAPILVNTPDDLNARASMMWCATNALNGQLGCGVPVDFACHRIGHYLTAHYGIVHAKSLTTLYPAILKVMFKDKKEKLAQCAKRVFGVTGQNNDTIAKAGIEAIVEFFKSLGLPTSLSEADLKIDTEIIVAEAIGFYGTFGEKNNIDTETINNIFKTAE
jgi:NADP-dependent alcohol dehydrogenase